MLLLRLRHVCAIEIIEMGHISPMTAFHANADLVPVYHLGQTQLLTFWGTESISRSWRMSVGLFWGAYGLPLPRKSQIISLVGAPIPGGHCCV